MIAYQLTLRWRHNEPHVVSNHQPRDCLLNRLFRRRSKKPSKLCVTGLCAGNSPVTGEFPAQRASNAENVSIWWRHHGDPHNCHKGDMPYREARWSIWKMGHKSSCASHLMVSSWGQWMNHAMALIDRSNQGCFDFIVYPGTLECQDLEGYRKNWPSSPCCLF